MLPLRYSSSSSSSHQIYFKEHSVRNQDETKPPGRTLFVLNIPPYVTEDSLKEVFSVAGKIQNISLQSSTNAEENKSNNGFKLGYIVFKKRDDLLKALKLNNLKPLSTETCVLKTGLSKWKEQYNSSICGRKELSEEINNYLQKLEKLEKQNQKKTEVDEDGWTVVTKKGRNPGVSRKESVELKLKEKMVEKTKKKELQNFYTFQIRESKMKNIATLRKNYEEAKKKVNAMKTARRFKPY